MINNEITFENAIKKAGRSADKTIFNDIIGCIKKISDIRSEVTLSENRIYLGIVNKFKKDKKDYYFVNYDDETKIVKLPNFEGIKENTRNILGDKFNNPLFKYNKFNLKGSFTKI